MRARLVDEWWPPLRRKTMDRRLMTCMFALAVAWGVCAPNGAHADMRALFYEYEASEQWYWQLVTDAVKKANGETIQYELTTDAQADLTPANLRSYDMLLFGTHGIGGWGVYHLDGVEQDLIDYVADGGFILVQTSDDAFYQGGMFPEELTMRESGDHDFEVTPDGEATGIFDTPNAIDDVIEDDSYMDVEDPWIVLATSADTGGPHTLLLPHGDGEYVVTSSRGEAEDQAAPNVPFVENIITYLVARIRETRPVSPRNALVMTWGALRSGNALIH